MSDFKSLLPSNTNQGLREFEQVTARTGDLPVDIHTLWNPAKCPAHLLGWLAWALSVDVWDQGWSEQTKRAVLAESVKVHRIKGTKKAVETALAAIGFETEIREWFETGEAPYTFQIDAFGEDVFAAGGGINLTTYNLVKRSIEHVKPARAHFEFRIGETFTTDQGMSTAMRDVQRSEMNHDPDPRTEIADIPDQISAYARVTVLSQVTHDVETRMAA